MNTTTLISPKSFLNRIIDIFQGKELIEPTENNIREITPHDTTRPLKSKLNISLEDLKVISTALLHYRRKLATSGELVKADDVARIDNQFYQLILDLERREESIENNKPTIAA